MKKLVAFLVLFGLALFALQYFERRTRPEDDPGEDPADVVDEPEPTPDGGSADPPPDGGTEGGGAGDGGTDETGTEPGMSFVGPSELTLYYDDDGGGRRTIALLVTSADTRTERAPADAALPEGADRLRDVLVDAVIRVFEREQPEDPQLSLEADSIVFPRALPDGEDEEEDTGLEFQPDWLLRADLTTVDGTLNSGVPFVPLTFSSRTAVLDARDEDARTLTAPGRIEIESAELVANGQELFVAFDREEFSFASDSSAVFSGPGGEEWSLRSSGPLLVQRRTDRTGRTVVEVEARDEAVLTLVGEERSEIAANRIRARLLPGEDVDAPDEEVDPEDLQRRYALEWFEADGSVVWTAGETEARAERARLDFEGAELVSWSLAGDPSLRVLVEDLQGLEDEDVPSRGFVRVTGVGPLTGTSGDVRTFEMQGPALIEAIDAEGEGLPHTTLRAAGSVRGSAQLRGEGPDTEVVGSTLYADGGVLLEAPEGSLETQALSLRLERGEDGVDVYRLDTTGSARLDARTRAELPEDELDLTLVTEGPLSATRTAETWRVEEAENATLVVEPALLDEDPTLESDVLRAQAGRVTVFDPIAGVLRAEGGVIVDSERGLGRGQRVVVEGERYELFGTASEPASFDGPEGKASAVYILRDGDRSLALGQVVTNFLRTGGPDIAEQDYEVRADRVEAEQLLEETEDGGERRVFLLDARGAHDEESAAALRADLVARGALDPDAADALPVLGRVDGRVGFGQRSSTVLCRTLTGERVERWVDDGSGAAPFDARTTISARGAIEGRLNLEGTQVDLECDALDLTRQESLVPRADGDAPAPDETPFKLVADARGAVEFALFTTEGAEPVDISGRGEQLQIDESKTGVLLPAPGGRVLLEGSLPGQETPYQLEADRIEFTGAERLEAVQPEITVERAGKDALAPGELDRFRARAELLVATEEALVLEGSVRLDTRTTADAPWALTAGRVELRGGVDGGGPRLDRLQAEDGVSVMLGLRGRALSEEVVARADAYRILGSTIVGAIRLEGFPDGRRTTLVTPALLTEAEWIEVDPELQLVRRSGPGRMLPAGEAAPGVPDWELRYSAARSFEEHETDSYIFALDQPYFESMFMDGLLRGTVALFKFDRVGWQDLPSRLEESRRPEEELREEALRPLESPVAPGLPFARFSEALRGRNLDGVLKQVYFEGPIEILRGDQLVAHAEAIFADALAGTARIVNAQLNIFGSDVGESFEKLIIRAASVRQDRTGLLTADRASVTTSPFAEPNVVVETGDLRLAPSPGQEDKAYQVYLRENRIRFRQLGLSLPLPSIAFGTDDELRPIWPTARLGNSARFGTLLTLGFRRPLPKLIGDPVHDALGGDEDDPYDASFSADASYLSGRGALFDIGIDIEAADEYELEMIFGIVPDSGDDEGYIQVPESERDNPRLWYRAHSRFDFDPDEWIDIEASFQSDASVQSEFWEDEFERYERDESYAQWRKADGETYYQATAKTQFDSFRSTVEELPSLGAYFGRRPVFDLGLTQVVWDADIEASYLRRRAGESGVQSPFAETPPLNGSDEFLDGLGERETLRLDADQRVELPLDVSGVRATPFVGARFTGWDEGENPEASPTRFLAEAGVRLATQLWRRNSGGTMHQLAPFVEAAGAVVEESVGSPVAYSRVEAPIGGDRLDLGLRGRLGVAEGTSLFDFELRARHQRDVPDGVSPGWQPLSVFARLDVEPLGKPVQVWHDARYDMRDGTTRYALTAVGVRASDALAFEVGHRTGLATDDERLFEAAVLSALYRWSEKWEFEGRQVYSLLNDNGLDAGLILRRYGSDLIFELEFETREGEGSSVGISLRPRFGYRPSGIGTISY